MSELPQSWVQAPIGSLCVLYNGRAFKKSEWSNTGLPIIRIQNLKNEEAEFNYFDGDLNAKHLIKSGDLLFAWSGTPGTSFGAHEWRGENGALNQHIFKIEFNESSIDKAYFRYAINHQLERLIGRAQGAVGLRHVTKKEFEATEIFFPPGGEQTRIANKLDILLAKVQDTQARLEKIPGILKRFRQSVLAAATSGELTKEWRSETKAKWVKTTLESVSEIKDPHPSHRTPKEKEGGVPYIGIGDLNADGSIDFDGARKVSRDVWDDHQKRYRLKEGDFVFGKIGTLGKATFLPIGKEYVLSANVILIQPNTDLVAANYLMYLLSSPETMKEVARQSNSTSQAAFGIKKMRAFVVLLPSKDEQKEIAHRVESLFALADTVEKQYQAAKQRTDRLTQSLLAKAFRGELVPQDPNDEPADKLLERIASEIESKKSQVKKPTIPKKNHVRRGKNMTPEQISDWLDAQEGSEFSFEELNTQFSDQYDGLKDAVFEMLASENPVITQIFDNSSGQVKFLKING